MVLALGESTPPLSMGPDLEESGRFISMDAMQKSHGMIILHVRLGDPIWKLEKG